jgi:hypothetical protein
MRINTKSIVQILLLICISCYTLAEMVNAKKHHKYGHAGHKCLHGIKGICGKPSECNGELQRGHCKGNSNNVCCMKTKQVTLKGDDRSSSS